MENKKQKVELYSDKVAKLPKGTDATAFMEKIKIPKNKLWYVLVEKQDNELHMVKFNEEGVDANQFVAQLKEHYINSSANPKMKELIAEMQVVGNDKFSIIKNIPSVSVSVVKNSMQVEKPMVTMIMEDLIRLLSKD